MNLRDLPLEAPQTDEVLIKVHFSGICGSELGGYLGHNSLRVPPLVMGHEFSGEIVKIGDAVSDLRTDLQIGQRVTVNPLLHNPWSGAAKEGRQNLDRARAIIGIHRPGSYAEYVTAPATNVYPIPDKLTLEMAALTEPMACAVRAASLAHVQPVDTVLITGLGPIGLLIMQVVRAAGARIIIATDTDSDRRSIGEEFGIHVLDPAQSDVVAVAHDLTGGTGVTCAIDAVGADATRSECIRAVEWGGRVIFTGLHAEESTLPANYIIRSEINIQGSFAYTTVDFENALQWLIDERVNIKPWLLRAPLSEGGACFERLLDRPGPVTKILLQS